MAKRKIDVDKLTEDQFKNAQQKIYEKVSSEIDKLVNKWKPILKQYGKSCNINVLIEEGVKEDLPIETEVFTIDSCLDSNLTGIAKDLEKISKDLQSDIDGAIATCNNLLNRYGLYCDMAIADETHVK